MESYLNTLKKWITFNGRATRKEYWSFVGFNILLRILIFLALLFLNEVLYLPFLLVILFISIAELSCGIRRLHDINKSGLWYFIVLIPIIGSIWYIILMLTPSVNEGNVY